MDVSRDLYTFWENSRGGNSQGTSRCQGQLLYIYVFLVSGRITRGLALWKANKIGNWGWGNLWRGCTSPRWIWWDTKGTNHITWSRNCLQRGVEYQWRRNYGEIRPSLRDFFHWTHCSKITNFCIDKVSKSTSLEVTTRRTDNTYIVIDYAWCICAFNFVVGCILRRFQL